MIRAIERPKMNDHLGHVIDRQMESFGETLKRLRLEKKLLLREVASMLEIDPSLLSRIESGYKKPTREQVHQLASIFEVDVEPLMVSYLSAKILYQVQDEDLGFKAMMVAEAMMTYRRIKKGEDDDDPKDDNAGDRTDDDRDERE